MAVSARVRVARFTLVPAFVASLALAGAAQVTLKPIEQDPVRIDGGLLSGTYLTSDVKAYLGVPFAAPPLRELRWKAPQPVTPWEGVYTANRMPPECTQNLRSNNINHYFGDELAGEDCLYLNIWAPASARAGANLPVVVWIYGGAFTGGSASMPLYSGEPLAKKGVIYVGINYRLGVFGFLAHPELTKESGHDASGNWAFLDQIAGLQWVSRNIAAFGGDRNNVTIIGQSAGAASLNNLQASPLAKGLFHKVFGMSGSTITWGGTPAASLQNGEALGVRLQEALKVSSLAELRTFSSDKVMAAVGASNVNARPIMDGYVLPKTPRQIFEARQQSDVPLVIGSTAHDTGTTIEIRRAQTLQEYRAAAERMFGARVEEFLALYPATTDAEARAQAEIVGRSSGVSLSARTWAHAQATHGRAPAYLFLFSRTQPYTPGVTFPDHDPKTAGSYHAADVPYWLGTLDSFNAFRSSRSWTPLDRDLADKMMDMVVAFARTGSPATQAVPAPRYDLAREQLIELGDTIRVVDVNTKGADFLASR